MTKEELSYKIVKLIEEQNQLQDRANSISREVASLHQEIKKIESAEVVPSA